MLDFNEFARVIQQLIPDLPVEFIHILQDSDSLKDIHDLFSIIMKFTARNAKVLKVEEDEMVCQNVVEFIEARMTDIT